MADEFGISLSLKNEKLVKEAIKKAGDQMFHNYKQLIKDTAYFVEYRAKQLAPVDSGRLKASIGHFSKGDLASSKDMKDIDPSDAVWEYEELRAVVGTNVEYAEKMEYGGAVRARNSDGRVPEAYMRPAAALGQQYLDKKIHEAISKALNGQSYISKPSKAE